MDALSKLEADYTFKQHKIPTGVKSLGKNIYSSDMSAFTDRFDRSLEKAVVERVFDPEVADRWDTIIADRYFSIMEDKNVVRHVKYEVGNPMGVLSS